MAEDITQSIAQNIAQNKKAADRQFRKSSLAACLLGIMLLFGGCGADSRNSVRQGMAPEGGGAGPSVTGRYMEEQISTNYEGNYPVDIFPTEAGVYLARSRGMDELLVPDGADVEAQALPAGAFRSIVNRNMVFDMAVAENGARIFSTYEKSEENGQDGAVYHKYFLTAEGSRRGWDDYVGEGQRVSCWYGRDGYFYVNAIDSAAADYSSVLYRVGVGTGETEYLWKYPSFAANLAVCGDYLFASCQDDLIIYSLSDKKRLPEDLLLSETIKKCQGEYAGRYSNSWLIAPSAEGEGIYLLTKEGLFYHAMYGSVMEQMIEGSLCSIGDITKLFVAMCVTESGPGDMPVFWLAYDSGEVVRFVYDADVPSVPDTMVRIYSLHDDGNVRQAVAGYQKDHPELYLQYETGMAEGMGQTEEDALKNLATRIASGDGPDVFVMDGIPYDAYVEKGVLKDLAEIYGELGAAGSYFDNVVKCFCREEKLYAIPAAFQVTVLMGEEERIKGVDSLEELASLLEGMAAEGTSKIGLLTEERILTAMAMVSGGWINEGRELDEEALGRFLRLCRRIYAADRAGMSGENLWEEIADRTNTYMTSGGGYVYDFKNGNQLYCGNTLVESYSYYQNPLFMGSMGGDIVRELWCLLAKLAYLGKDYRLMSDEGTGCIPVSMLAVNNASKVQREAEDFVKYVLGADFQRNAVLSGIPINSGVLAQAVEENRVPSSTLLGDPNSTISDYVAVTGEGISEEEFQKFMEMLGGIDRVNIREAVVYDAVMEFGAAAVNGERSVEETVEAVAKKVRLYLAE